jgi:hypothetical protein
MKGNNMKNTDERLTVKTIKVGKYSAGLKTFNLHVRTVEEPDGASFWLSAEEGDARIVVDINAPWEDVWTWLLHEITEMVYSMRGHRSATSPSISLDNGQYLFVMSHTDFSECTSWVAEAIDTTRKDMKRAWRKYSTFYKENK